MRPQETEKEFLKLMGGEQSDEEKEFLRLMGEKPPVRQPKSPAPPAKDKMGFLEQLNRQFRDLSAGAYNTLASATRGAGWLGSQTPPAKLASWLGGDLGVREAAEGPAQWLSEQGQAQSIKGMPEGLTKSLYRGTGQFIGDLPFLMAGGGLKAAGAAGQMRPFLKTGLQQVASRSPIEGLKRSATTLGTLGGVHGAGEEGTKGAVKGAASGALLGGVLGGIHELPSIVRPAASAATGYFAPGASQQEQSDRIANAFLFYALDRMGGRGKTTREFLSEQTRVPMSKKKATALRDELRLEKKHYGLSEEQNKILNQVEKPKFLQLVKSETPEALWNEALYSFVDSKRAMLKNELKLEKQVPLEESSYWHSRAMAGIAGKFNERVDRLRDKLAPVVQNKKLYQGWRM